ncbi:DBH-like monooxygenase protein 1-like [Exaiptasia diaphana]|nr:DBH-like monooxygenase protein 1-like [Exaiptasia diaphana]
MPAEVLGCRREGLMAGGWAVGGGPFIYPSHVGFAVGSEFAGRHFILEIHYDNPGQKSDFYDSSGMRFYYTNKLREYDAGLLSGGVVTSKWMMIPPKQQAWKTVGYCSKQCTEEALKNSPLPEGGIKIFSSNLHTHLAGRAAWTQHIRNGVELPEIDRDDNYDFNFQDARTLEREIHFKPGDEIIQTCIYNTMDRENMTYGGAATTDEMCLNYLTYYPFLPNMSRVCRSIDLQAGSAMLKKYYPELKSPTKAMRNPIMASNKIWTKEMIDDYKKMLDGQTGYSATSHGCKNRNSYNLNLTLEEAVKDKYQIPIPKITTPLPKPTDNCKDVNSSAITLSVWFLSHVVCLVAVTILT